MRLLPESRRSRVAVAAGLAALVALGVYSVLDEYRPWEQPRFRGRPASWWGRALIRAKAEWQWRTRGGPPPNARCALERFGLFPEPRVVLPPSESDDPAGALVWGGREALPVLRKLLAGRDRDRRLEAARLLGGFVDEGRSRAAVPVLLPLLADPDEGVRGQARAALRRIDPAALAAYDRDHPQE